MQRKLKDWTETKEQRKNKEGTSNISPKKGCFDNNTTQTSQATSNTSNLYLNADITQWIEARINKEGDIGMRKGRRKSNVENTNE